MKPGDKYEKYTKTCPFCKSEVTNFLGCNLFCECGAKYYFQQGAWLNRNTGEEVFEHEQELDDFMKSIDAPPLIKWQRALLLKAFNTPYRAQYAVYWRLNGYDKLVEFIEQFEQFLKEKENDQT